MVKIERSNTKIHKFMNKKLFFGVGLVLIGLLFLPNSGRAQTMDTAQLQALIQRLQAQVMALQTQLNGVQQMVATSTSYILTVSKPGSGSGTVTGPGINCGSDCSESFASGTTVWLYASPAAGSLFTSWSGCNIASGTSCSVLMNTNKSVSVYFTATTYALSVNKTGTGTGTVTGPGINCGSDCSESYVTGTVVSLNAAPAVGSLFGGWAGCGSVSGTLCNVVMSSNKTVTATFNQAITPTTTLTVTLAGIGSGQVRGQGINCGAGNYDCSEVFSLGSSVELEAGAAPGSKFVSWTGCNGVSSTICFVTMNTNRNVTANFNKVFTPILLEASAITAMQQQLNDIRMKLEEISAKLRTSPY